MVLALKSLTSLLRRSSAWSILTSLSSEPRKQIQKIPLKPVGRTRWSMEFRKAKRSSVTGKYEFSPWRCVSTCSSGTFFGERDVVRSCRREGCKSGVLRRKGEEDAEVTEPMILAAIGARCGNRLSTYALLQKPKFELLIWSNLFFHQECVFPYLNSIRVRRVRHVLQIACLVHGRAKATHLGKTYKQTMTKQWQAMPDWELSLSAVES